MRGIAKRYGPVHALQGARLDAYAGEVHAVVGENGAGKTTLLSVLAGLVLPDEGTIRIAGTTVDVHSAREAWRHGIGMVHQDFALVDRMSVVENLALGRRRGGGLRLGLDEVREEARSLGRRVGLVVPLEASVEELGVGERQRVEILKVLMREPSVLVLDEPTAVLTPAEVEGLLELLRRLADEGRAVVLVAHKLDEVLAVADRVTVLRDGQTVLETPRAGLEARDLAIAMVGSAPAPLGPGSGGAIRVGAGPRSVVARMVGVSVGGAGLRQALTDVDLEVAAGEIVGVAGVEGNGQRELARILAGRMAPDSGSLELPHEPAFIPQDRRREGLVASFDLTENVALRAQRDPANRRGPWLRWDRLRSRTRALLAEFAVRAPGPGAPASALSGGNQQRLVVARELDGEPRLIVAEDPTRGLDVAGAAFVHHTLRARVDGDDPPGVVLISTDLDEVMALADRVVVLMRGRLRPVPDAERTREGIGARMLEGSP